MAHATRLRYISSPSPDGLEAVLNALPFKVEIKSIVPQGQRWFLWFVLPDNVAHKDFEKQLGQNEKIEFNSINLEDI